MQIKRAAVLAVLLAGCGHTIHRPSQAPQAPPNRLPAPKAQVSAPCPPPPGEGYMGACATKPVQIYPHGVATPLLVRASAALTAQTGSGSSHGMFPDVSSWQGYVNWPAVKAWQQGHGWLTGAVFKMGEYTTDPYAFYNATHLHQLGMWAAGYWFVRNTGCSHEASQVIALAQQLAIKVVVLDMEVPESSGYAGCLGPPLKNAGLTVVIYTAPGTWAGGAGFGSAPLWQATYGSGFSPFWQPVVAWQCTDGVYGCRTYVPGIGYDDVSVDYSLIGMGAIAPDPFKLAIFPTAPFTYQGNRLPGERSIVRAYDSRRPGHPITTDGRSAHYAREACLAQDRIWHLVPAGHHSSKFAEWKQANRIERWPYLQNICKGRQALTDFKP